MNCLTGTDLDELHEESDEIIRNARAAFVAGEIDEEDYMAICRRAAVVEA